MKKVLGRIFWTIVILLMCLWTFEFYRVRNGYEPLFCFKSEVHTYIDGSTKEFIGLGYKVYQYDRYQLYGSEFVSIFAHERTNGNENLSNEPVDNTTSEEVK